MGLLGGDMTKQPDGGARLRAHIRIRLIDAARTTIAPPDILAIGDDAAVRAAWDSVGLAHADAVALGPSAVLAEYLVGFHGLSPADALHEVTTLPAREAAVRCRAAWQDVCDSVPFAMQTSDTANPTPEARA